MTTQTMKKILIAGALSFVIGIVVVPQTFAKEGAESGNSGSGSSSNSGKTTTTKRTEAEHPVEVEDEKSSDSDDSSTSSDVRREDRRADVPSREKLDDKKRSVCNAAAPEINQVISNVAERTKRHSTQIENIYSLTKAFYEKSGLTVSDYDALVATVDTKKALADAAAQKIDTQPKFSCDSDGPKADLQTFRNARIDKVDAFKEYRDAVKALINAVKTAAKEAKATTSSTTEEAKQ